MQISNEKLDAAIAMLPQPVDASSELIALIAESLAREIDNNIVSAHSKASTIGQQY